MKKLILFALLFAPIAWGNGCSDILSGQMLQNVQLPVLEQTVSPTADVLRVVFFRKLSLEIGPVVNNWIYVMPRDAVELNQTVGNAGWQYYLGSNESGYFRINKNSNWFTYVCESGVKHNLTMAVALGELLALEGGKTVKADVVRVKSSVPDAFYDSNYSVVSDEFIVVTADSVDSGGDRVFKGAMYAKQNEIYYFIDKPGSSELADIYPSLRYLACCSSKNCSTDFESNFKPSSCSASLFSKSSFCSDENTLVKYSCGENDACLPEHAACEFGCVNGTCFDGTRPTCEDFYGENIYVRNSVSGVFQNKTTYAFTNKCESLNKVSVWSCYGGAPVSRVFDCPLGCESGRCVEAQQEASVVPSVQPSVEKQPPAQGENNALFVIALLIAFAALAWWVLRLPPAQTKK